MSYDRLIGAGRLLASAVNDDRNHALICAIIKEAIITEMDFLN